MEGENNEKIKTPCTNCGKEMSEKAAFCSKCGQKKFTGKFSMLDMLSKFWIHVVHLDNKFLQMSKNLFVPGKVTNEFFQGKIKRYAPPVQFFFIVMFFFLFAFNHNQNRKEIPGNEKDDSGFSLNVNGNNGKSEPFSSARFQSSLEKYAFCMGIWNKYQDLPEQYKNSESLHTLDTVLSAYLGPDKQLLEILSEDSIASKHPDSLIYRKWFADLDSLNIGVLGKNYNLATRDVIVYPPDKLCEKYGFTHWAERIMITQTIKSFRQPTEFGRFYLGSLTWTILAVICCMSGVLYLLYIRRRRFFVEHFIFLLHLCSAIFLAFAIYFALPQGTYRKLLAMFLVLGTQVFLFFSMYRYYGQSARKTLLKWFLYNALFFPIVIFCAILGLLVCGFFF